MFAPEAVTQAARALPPIPESGLWLPHAGSTLAPDVDKGWDYAMWVSVITFLIVVVAMGVFIVKYKRRTPNDITEELDHSTKLEVAWSVIPLIAVFALFFVGLRGYVNAAIAPRGAYEIRVQAQKWSWTYTYPNGVVSGSGTEGSYGDGLVVPKGEPIKIILSSTDVLHSFYIPEFRVKQDVVPGSYTTLWFEATRAGETLLECAEFCGKDHSHMLSRVIVKERPDFDKWLAEKGKWTGPLDKLGEQLYTERGCKGCHSIDGTLVPNGGPSFKGIWGKTESLADGSTVVIDENYVRESVNVPSAKVVKGFPNGVMPTFQGTLNEQQLAGIIEFIKAQK
jgi:cytochrome c oxidase subunit II